MVMVIIIIMWNSLTENRHSEIILLAVKQEHGQSNVASLEGGIPPPEITIKIH